jgi:hypothetical protein
LDTVSVKSNRRSACVEYSGAVPKRGGRQHVIDFGTSDKPSQHSQVDCHWSFGLPSADVVSLDQPWLFYCVQVIRPR